MDKTTSDRGEGILLCLCKKAGLIDEQILKKQRASLLKETGKTVVVVDDLCHIAAKDSGKLNTLSHCKNLEVRACHERAAEWILRRSDFDTGDKDIEYVNLRTDTPTGADVASVCNCKLEKEAGAVIVEADQNWTAWYPVIDYDRCVSCGQCYSFCLFGVYEQDEETGKIRVANPDHCKDKCPACARACPEVAIIFPKLEEPPINGAPVSDETLDGSNVKVGFRKIVESEAYQKHVRQHVNPKRKRLIQMLSTTPSRCDCDQRQ